MSLRNTLTRGGAIAALLSVSILVPSLVGRTADVAPASTTSFAFSTCNTICVTLTGQPDNKNCQCQGAPGGNCTVGPPVAPGCIGPTCTDGVNNCF